MLTVTFKLKNPPEKADIWGFRYGAKTPFASYMLEWFSSKVTTVDKPLTVEMDNTIRYIRVAAQYSKVPGYLYLFETTTPFVFADKTTYIWDCSTNSLSEEEALPVQVPFVITIFTLLSGIADWFYDAYTEVNGWISPFCLLATPLYALHTTFTSLLYPLVDFDDWVEDVVDKVKSILSTSDIATFFKDIFDAAVNAWEWVTDAVTNVKAIADTWWEDIKLTVQGWIDIAETALEALIETVSTALATLQEAWDSFKDNIPSLKEVILWWGDWWAEILTPLTTWWDERLEEVDMLIDSTLKVWFPFYDDLVKLWDSIAEFFVNPLDWIAGKLEDWFWGVE